MSNAKTYIVTGDTYGRRDKIKKAGGTWDGSLWTVTLYKGDSLWRYEGAGQCDLAFTEVADPEPNTAKQHDDLYNEGGEGYNPYR